MDLVFLGTRGYIEKRKRRHRRHSGVDAGIAHDGMELSLDELVAKESRA